MSEADGSSIKKENDIIELPERVDLLFRSNSNGSMLDIASELSDVREFADLVVNFESIPEGDRVVVNEYTGDVNDEDRARKVFFNDDIHRIDYILVWRHKDSTRRGVAKQEEERDKVRQIFERNLRAAGLLLEKNIKEGREEQYLKIHVPYEVLALYAELMKIRMPIKESPEEVGSLGLWDVVSSNFTKCFHPFELDPRKVPIMQKRYTAIFDRNKEYLFRMPDDKNNFFTNLTRSRIADYILRRTKYSVEPRHVFSSGINRLLANDTYLAAYLLHEGSWKPESKPSMRRLLYNNWATWRVWYKLQPLQYIRLYFGEKIGLYFAWMGYYTYSLIPVSVVGLLVFLYGALTIHSDSVAIESCDKSNNFTMCPMCNLRCGYWDYSQICYHIRATHLFDNAATVFFAVFMSVWGTFYLEFWKREEAGIQFLWDVSTFTGEEEPPRPEFLARSENSKYHRVHSLSQTDEPYYPFWKRQVPVYMTSTATMAFLVIVAIAATIGIILYRISVLAVLYIMDDEFVYKNATILVSITAALINLVIIFVLNYVYARVTTALTDWECQRTQSEYDNSITLKFYVLQFVNYYSSLFYIAFFKGRFIGMPSNYVTFKNARQEECQGGSCLTELCIQLAIIFVGKQLIQNNLMEIYLPRLKRFLRRCNKKKEMLVERKPWEKDYTLDVLGPMGLFDEYLEMMIQFGFVTLFAAAFPLAPFFALINNMIELRADANKFVTQYRRTMTSRAKTIGVWYDILYGLSRLAIITNAMIIAFTSSFIHRYVYRTVYSPTGTMEGYVNNSLAFFNVTDFPEGFGPHPSEITPEYIGTQLCRYPDYREPPSSINKYDYTPQHWHVVAAQFIFVVVFENFIVLITSFVAYVIPDMPRKLNEQMRREAVVSNEIILQTELKRARGDDNPLSNTNIDDIRKFASGAVQDSLIDDGQIDELQRNALDKLMGGDGDSLTTRV